MGPNELPILSLGCSTLSKAEYKNDWSYISLPLYSFIVWRRKTTFFTAEATSYFNMLNSTFLYVLLAFFTREEVWHLLVCYVHCGTYWCVIRNVASIGVPCAVWRLLVCHVQCGIYWCAICIVESTSVPCAVWHLLVCHVQCGIY